MTKTMSHEELYTEVEKLLDSGQPSDIKAAYSKHKQMVACYVNTAVQQGYCYDHVNLERLLAQITKFPVDYRLGLLRHLRRIYALNYIEYDKALLDKETARVELTREFRKRRPTIRLLLGLLSYNTLTVFCLLLFSIVFMSIVFLPAKWNWAEMFDCETLPLCTNSWLNAVCNVLCLLFLDVAGVSVKPINVFGLLTLVLFKIFNLVVIINFCCKKLLEKLGVNNVD